jgi:glycosyltransferase involved in cell wall biosynthesis
LALQEAERAFEGSSRRIAVFLQDLYGGGAEQVMLRLATGMAEQGRAVDLVLVRREGAFAGKVPPSVRIVELGTRRTINSVLALGRYLRRERPAVLMTALVHVNIAALLARLTAPGTTRVVLTEHNQISMNIPPSPSFTLRFAYRLVPLLYPRASRIIAVSDGVADDLSRFSGVERNRIDVVHNPVVTPELAALADEPVDHPWFAPGEPPVILGVGRLSDQKDFATLLRAFALVCSRRPARLVILGEGGYRAELEQLVAQLGIGSDVDLPGFAGNPFAYMSKASLFVLSSKFEGLPGALIEAMACGTPVVATDCPSGPREILEGGSLGGLVPVGDPESLAAAIGDALDQPAPPDRLRAKAAEYTVDRAVRRYLALLEQGGRSSSR